MPVSHSIRQSRYALTVFLLLPLVLTMAAGPAKPPLRVGFRYSPPFQYLSNRQADGLAVALVREAARRSGMQIEWVYHPEGPDDALSHHLVDLWPLAVQTEERCLRFYCPEPWRFSDYYLITRPDAPRDIGSLRVAAPGFNRSASQRLLSSRQVTYFASREIAFESLCSGGSDALFAESSVVSRMLSSPPRTCGGMDLTLRKVSQSPELSGILAAPNSVEAADRLTRSLLTMERDDSAGEIYNRYGLLNDRQMLLYHSLAARERFGWWLKASLGLSLALLLGLYGMTRVVLARRRAALRISNLKSEFLETVSQELRTLISVATGAGDLLRESGLNKDQQTYLSLLRNVSESMQHLLFNLVDFSALQEGTLQLQQADFDLHSLMEDLAQQFAGRIESAKLEISTILSPDVPRVVKGDAVRIHQILYQLIDNAVKFTRVGEISIRVREIETGHEGYRLEFSVQDSGPGIEEYRRPKIFHFHRRRDHSPSGMGLMICRDLVAAMGGIIDFDSVPGQGSTFWFVIPLELPDLDLTNYDDTVGGVFQKVTIACSSAAVESSIACRLAMLGLNRGENGDICITDQESGPGTNKPWMLITNRPKGDWTNVPPAPNCLAILHKPLRTSDLSDALNAAVKRLVPATSP